jgi:hypothetical protein
LGVSWFRVSLGEKLVRPHFSKQDGNVVCVCDPMYLRGIGKEDCGSRQVLGKNVRFYLKNN